MKKLTGNKKKRTSIYETNTVKILCDTSAIFALFYEKEDKHMEVFEKYKQYSKNGALFYITNLVLSELYTRIIYKMHEKDAIKTIATIEGLHKAGAINLLIIDDISWTESLEIVKKYIDHQISFTDATTFVLYKNFKLDEIFTLDSDFKKLRAKTSF